MTLRKGLLLVGFLVLSCAAALALPHHKEKWRMASAGDGFVLSLSGASETLSSPVLEIRCDGKTTEVRLNTSMRVQSAGNGEGDATAQLGEEFRDDDQKPLLAASGSEETSSDWVMSKDGSYAALRGAAASSFLQRIGDRKWLYLHATSMSDDNRLSGSTMRFPVYGLGDYKARVASDCPAPAEDGKGQVP